MIALDKEQLDIHKLKEMSLLSPHFLEPTALTSHSLPLEMQPW